MKAILTQAELAHLLNYDPKTGVFTWKAKRCGVAIGSVAGSVDPIHGYVRVKISGSLYLAHRLAWLFVHGTWPESEVDHIDRNRANNRLVNLRAATRGENQRNKRTYATSRSGSKGVHWHKQHRKFIASIQANKKRVHLGLFESIDQAAAAYRSAAEKLHGEFAA